MIDKTKAIFKPYKSKLLKQKIYIKVKMLINKTKQYSIHMIILCKLWQQNTNQYIKKLNRIY